MQFEDVNSNELILEGLGKRVQRLRIKANLTQKMLAEKAGVSFRTIYNIESGKSINLAHLINIAVALGRSEDLNMILEVPEISPLEIARMKGKERERVRPKKEK